MGSLLLRCAGASLAFLLIGLLPTDVFAEVIDKELSLGQIWSWSAIFVGLALLLAHFRARLALAVLPLSMSFAIVQLLELNDPYVGLAILQEAGWNYVVQAYAAIVVWTLGPVGAAIWKLRRDRG